MRRRGLRCVFAHALYSPTSTRRNLGPTTETPHSPTSTRRNHGPADGTPRYKPVNGAKPRTDREHTPLTARQRGKTSHRPRFRATHNPSAKQNPGPTDETPRPHTPNEAKPRPSQRNTPLTARQRGKTTSQSTKCITHTPPAERNLGQTTILHHSPSVSKARPRYNRRIIQLAHPQRGKPSAQPTEHPTHAIRGMRLSQTAGHAM